MPSEMARFTITLSSVDRFGLGPVEEDLLPLGVVVNGDHKLARFRGSEGITDDWLVPRSTQHRLHLGDDDGIAALRGRHELRSVAHFPAHHSQLPHHFTALSRIDGGIQSDG